MERVLRIDVRDRPEAILTIEPSTKGTLAHAILEQFIAAQLRLPRSERIEPTTAWSPSDHDRLDAIAERVFAEYETKGLPGARCCGGWPGPPSCGSSIASWSKTIIPCPRGPGARAGRAPVRTGAR